MGQALVVLDVVTDRASSTGSPALAVALLIRRLRDDGDDAAAPADHEDAAASAGAAPSAPQRSPDAALVPQRRARDEDDDLAEQIAKRTSAEGAARRAPKLEVRVSAQTRRMAAGDEPT